MKYYQNTAETYSSTGKYCQCVSTEGNKDRVRLGENKDCFSANNRPPANRTCRHFYAAVTLTLTKALNILWKLLLP